jgi:cellulose synthase (UDP-forming)
MMKQINPTDKTDFLKTKVNKALLALNIVMAIMYFFVVVFGFAASNHFLFGLLIAGEVFHLWQVIGLVSTIWETDYVASFDASIQAPVDVFITVAGEPVEIVRETAIAALNMKYPNFSVHLLNDGFVAGKADWKDIVDLGEELGINVITRQIPGGAKAGNINNGLAETRAPYFVVFDADHVPHRDFLEKTMGHFTDAKMGFVQTPQYYKNHAENAIAATAWEQQTLFFGPIMKGKNRLGSVFMCGTNMVVRRAAIAEAGGMCEFNIAEDFLTSLFIHAKGYKSVYVPEVLAEGLAPEDFLSYYKQQYRWTRGSLEVIFKYNPLFMKGLTIYQRYQYLASASYYLSGVVVLMNALLPIVFLYSGLVPVQTSTMLLALSFIPYIFINLLVLQWSSNFSYTFRAISFSLSSFFIQLRAIYAVLTNQKTSFVVTSKQQIEGNFLYLAIPHFIYIALYLGGLAVAIMREGVSTSVINNSAWALLTIAIFVPFIVSAAPKTGLLSFKRSKPAITIPVEQ